MFQGVTYVGENKTDFRGIGLDDRFAEIPMQGVKNIAFEGLYRRRQNVELGPPVCQGSGGAFVPKCLCLR
jgi:hypothetical protein